MQNSSATIMPWLPTSAREGGGAGGGGGEGGGMGMHVSFSFFSIHYR